MSNVLFKEQVSGERLKSLNPMRVVAFKAKDGRQRFLDFEFRQVWNQGRVMSLLVSVSDITEKAGLASELAQIKDAANVEVESLLSILDSDPEVVVSFLESCRRNRLRLVNSQLKKFGVPLDEVGQGLELARDLRAPDDGDKRPGGLLEGLAGNRSSSFFMRNPAPRVLMCPVIPTFEAWLRWALPKASSM